MAQIIKSKRSSIKGKIPIPGDLELGELALNTFDGKAFVKIDTASGPGTEQIIEIGADRLEVINVLTDYQPDVTKYARHYVNMLGTDINIQAPVDPMLGDKGKIVLINDDTPINGVTFDPVYRFANMLVPEINTSAYIATVMAYEVLKENPDPIVVVDLQSEFYAGPPAQFLMVVTSGTQPRVDVNLIGGGTAVLHIDDNFDGTWNIYSYDPVTDFVLRGDGTGGITGPTKAVVVRGSNITTLDGSFYSGTRGEENGALEEIIFMNTFNPLRIDSCRQTFRACNQVVSLDLTQLATGFTQCTDFTGMFYTCQALTCFSNIDTTNVNSGATTDMFYNCLSLKYPDATDQSLILGGKSTNGISWVHPTGIPCPDVRFRVTVESSVQPTLSYTDSTGAAATAVLTETTTGSGMWVFESYEVIDAPFFNAGVAAHDSITTITFNRGFDIQTLTELTGGTIEATGFAALTTIVYEPEFDTSRILSTSNLFAACATLESVQGLVVPNTCTDISNMFLLCDSLTDISTITWDTSNVTTTASLFYGCSSLTTLDTSVFNTSNTTTMSRMFYNALSLTTLDTSTWDTSALTDTSLMFYGCTSLTSIDVSTWNTPALANTSSMFDGCTALTTANVSGLVTSGTTTISRLFRNCTVLPIIDVSTWDTSAVTDMNSLFIGCSSLTTIDLSAFVLSAAPSAYSLFEGCSSLTSFNLTGWSAYPLSSITSFFKNCSVLASADTNKTIQVSDINISIATQLDDVFYGCAAIETMDLTPLDTSAVASFGGMFSQCTSLTCISPLDTTGVGAIVNPIFTGDSALLNPTASEVTQLESATGLNYVNANSCGTYNPQPAQF